MPRVLILSMIMAMCLCHVSIATIRNGYARNANEVEKALFDLSSALASNNSLSANERKSIKERMLKMVLHLACLDATDQLLSQFRAISPDLYSHIDSLKDAQGRPVDVFVKIILKEQATIMAAGVTRMLATEDDRDACISEYGRQTVSVSIWAVANSLITLAHEMGHIAYQVPNFDRYVTYYQSRYHHPDIQGNCMGHEPDDEGGKMALLFERKFKRDRAVRFNTLEPPFMDSAPVLVLDAQKRIASSVFVKGKRPPF